MVASMISIEPGSGPTVRRIRLGSQLRRLREASGVSREEAGYLIRASESKISRMELGRVGFKVRDVVDLLVRYGVEDEAEREALVTLARQANAPAWWHQYSDLLPTWFQTYLGLEEAASVLRVYEVQFIPGLLQTVDYMRAIMTRARPRASESEIERRVRMRQNRQQMFARADGPHLWAVIDEAALRRPIGGTEVFRAQVKHLIAMADEPKITLQVVPFRLGAHSAESGAFTIMRFPAPDLPDVVYVEQLTGALYLEKSEDVDSYSEAMELLSIASEPPGHTPDFLRGILADFA
jgi:hypothetical protein